MTTNKRVLGFGIKIFNSKNMFNVQSKMFTYIFKASVFTENIFKICKFLRSQEKSSVVGRITRFTMAMGRQLSLFFPPWRKVRLRNFPQLLTRIAIAWCLAIRELPHSEFLDTFLKILKGSSAKRSWDGYDVLSTRM